MSELLDTNDHRIDIEEGFYLSRIVQRDKEAYLLHYQDPSIAHNLLRVPYPYTEEHVDFRLDYLEKNRKDPEVVFAIRRPDGFMIGSIAVDIETGAHKAEFGYWLAKEYRGINLMPAVIQVFSKYIFEKLGIHRMQATIFWFNDASGRALTKAGFTKEGGILRHYYHKNGEYIDAISYSLLSTDVLPEIHLKLPADTNALTNSNA
jgi:ribosomal-protein-alanine N-acetyltransferase